MTEIPDVLKAQAANPKPFFLVYQRSYKPVSVIGYWNLRPTA
jgi:hypothetical protein